MVEAIRAVIADEDVPTVGETSVGVFSRRDSLFYVGSSFEMDAGIVEVGVDIQLGEVLERPVHASGGTFTLNVLGPNESGIAAVGIYVWEGRFGLLYLPLKHDVPLMCTDIEPREFRVKVKADYGLTLRGDPKMFGEV